MKSFDHSSEYMLGSVGITENDVSKIEKLFKMIFDNSPTSSEMVEAFEKLILNPETKDREVILRVILLFFIKKMYARIESAMTRDLLKEAVEKMSKDDKE